MPSPAPCPTPVPCPLPEPCSEVFDAQCVVYTGPNLSCDEDAPNNDIPTPNPPPAPIVTTNDTVAEALENIVDYLCENLSKKTIEYVTVTEAPINITAQSGEHYVVLGLVDGAIYSNLLFNLTNPGSQSIGDKLYIISQPDTTVGNITYCYDANNFYIQACGGTQNPPCSFFSSGEEERDVTTFIYDGGKYCSTFDNC